MKTAIFGESVQGASHKRSGTPCQDSHSRDGEAVLPDGTIILAVADGHGSRECEHSKSGSTIAVNVFYATMKTLCATFDGKPDAFKTELNREGGINVAKAIDIEWKKRVLEAHARNKREMPDGGDEDAVNAKIYKKYGTTLLGLMLTETFLFAYQLGDGDIMYVGSGDEAAGPQEVIAGDKFLGTDTHSLSGKNSWQHALTCVRGRGEAGLPYMFMLSTDGFANSHKDEQEFRKTCADYFEMLKEHGSDAVSSNLKKWLDETSQQGCGDDITVLLAYFCEDAADGA